MVFKEVNPSMWIPKKDNEEIVGVLLEVQNKVGANDSKLYTLEVENKPVSIWGSAILDQRMISVTIGSLVKITYKGLGEATAGHNAPKIFKVEVDEDEEEQ